MSKPKLDTGFRDNGFRIRGTPVEPEKIDHPPHYNAGGIEVIDAIESWSLGFHLGNAVKYIARADHKGSRVDDLKKARWYLDREIARAK